MSVFFNDRDFDLSDNEEAAAQANIKLSQIAISGFSQKHRGEWSFTERPMKGDTHNALLLNLGAIEPCAHEVHKVKDYFFEDYHRIFRCECGQEMEIGSFVEKKK